MSDYWKKKLDELEKSTEKAAPSTSYWQSKLNELEEEEKTKEEKKRKEEEQNSSSGRQKSNVYATTVAKTSKSANDDDIAPVVTTSSKDDDRKWFQKGAFEDGYQFGDVIKTILGTREDIGTNLAAGILGLGETITDTAAYVSAATALPNTMRAAQGEYYRRKVLGEEPMTTDEMVSKYYALNTNLERAASQFISQDLYNEEEVAKKIIAPTAVAQRLLGVDAEADSILGERAGSLVQSGGQLLATTALSAAGVPWWIVSGASAFGGQAEQALNENASFREAGASAAISAAAEVLSEKLSGGIKFGGKTLDDALLKPLTERIASKGWKFLTNVAKDAAGEGLEEVFSSAISNLGKKIYKDESIKELLFNEQALDEYLEGFFGGAILGGIGGVKNAQTTDVEQQVITHEYNKRVEAEKAEGKKLTVKDLSKIYNEVDEDVENGRISVDTIEEALGGEDYKNYKSELESEKANKEEYLKLYKMKSGDKSDADIERQAELKKLLGEGTKSTEIKSKVSDNVFKQVTGTRLLESYNERERKSQKYEADVSKYDEGQRKVIQSAIDSGILNNTTQTHRFVDMIAKISADKGVSFDFTNNAKLKETGFALDGKQVNGFVTKDGVTLNINSTKALNSVVGHEITHVLEGTELYTELRSVLFEYAKSKNDYQQRYAAITKLYEGVDGANVDAELASDLVGDYLFSDKDFIKRLSTEHRNIFQKIYDEIKYLCRVATAGSKEARELERVRKVFEDAYRASGKTQTDAQGETKSSLSENVTDAQNEQGLDTRSEISYSLSNDTAYMDKAISMNNSMLRVDSEVMTNAKSLRERIATRMTDIKDRGLVGIPEDIEGNTYIANSSYDGTEENTTVCPRSLAAEAFTDAVSEYLGRPLTVEEQIYISQDLQGRSLTPECTYCYVATDRKAYRAFLGEYISQRDAVIEKLSQNPDADVSRSGELYKEFLNGRKDTNPMYKRFKMWVDAYKNGTPMVEASHLANISKLMGDINSEFGEALKPQITDAMKYAQSASWAKKRINYVAYNGHILKWKQDRINKLNSHYGLRMYSFSDFHPAFVLENMQMITDASVRGLKMLGYTKDTDFVEIFAPSGMNINVSTFGFETDGNVYENNIIGAEWAKAQELRAKYPNVGVTFVATNDTLVNWALDQDWIDVVIPYHLVRTGAEVAKAFKYTNYTSESADTKTSEWTKGDKKSIAPTEHNNDKATYLTALEKNHLKPRFERFIDNPNYMKLVNECRQPASVSKPVQPIFNEDAAMTALAKLEANGYYQPVGGSVDRMYEIAAEVAEDMGKSIAPRRSLSPNAEQSDSKTRGSIYGEDIAYAPVKETVPVRVKEKTNAEVAPVKTTSNTITRGDKTVSEAMEVASDKSKLAKDVAPTKQRAHKGDVAKVLTKEPKTKKKKLGAWKWTKEHILDKGLVFEDTSLKTKNPKLQALWNAIRYADSKAQKLIGEGNDSVNSLVSIKEKVDKAGKAEAFFKYLYHMHNVDRMTLTERFGDVPNKAVFGGSVTANVSRKTAAKLLKSNPEFKQWADEVYEYNRYLRKLLVDNGIISNETAELWEQMYPHYVPIRREGYNGLNINVPLDTGRTGVNAPVRSATGGNSSILPLFGTMAQRTLQTYNAIAKNRFGIELKNTLNQSVKPSVLNKVAEALDELLEHLDDGRGILTKAENGVPATFTVFEDGKRVEFDITDEMYEALKPTADVFRGTSKILNTASNLKRAVITEYNPWFLIKNAIKDVQDVFLNSQHAAKTYAAIPSAIKQMASKGQWYQEYMDNGGDQKKYFNSDTNTFEEERKIPVLNFISKANNTIETLPRLAEYIASRKAGRSIEVSMMDAARVTTNFAAGGDVTKWLNRNGATFLNASVQGAMQQVRNIREAKMNGLRGWATLAAKYIAVGLPAVALNNLIWDDDEEYEDLSEYVKDNYYIVGKFGDGEFVRIPKGRTVAVIQDAFEQISNAITGDDEVDLKNFVELVITNLAPNDPLNNNVLSPLIQTIRNKTWYGEDLVPTRLEDSPAAEQYDESTDAISRWLGEKTAGWHIGDFSLEISPYKANYLLDQSSGVLGDTFLPMLTPEAESGDNTFAGNMIAPLKDMFTTDSVMNNQNVSDFYDLSDELTTNAKASDATDEDVLKKKYIDSVKSQISELYKEKREIQNDDLPDSEKYNKVRVVQSQINELAKNALSVYENISRDGRYAEIGGVYFEWYTPKNGDAYWRKLSDAQTTKYLQTNN